MFKLHIYEQDGKFYPSVTTIIHSLGSDELMRWSNLMGLYKRKKYDDLMEESSSFGTLIHSHLQYIVDPEHGNPIEPKNNFIGYDLNETLKKFQKWLTNITYKTIFTEKTIISPELGYGGTLDWFAVIDNLLSINDFKTAKKPQAHMFLQLGGYYNLLKSIGYNDIREAAIITANVKGCKRYPISLDLLEFYANAFTSLAEFYIKYELVNKLNIKLE